MITRKPKPVQGRVKYQVFTIHSGGVTPGYSWNTKAEARVDAGLWHEMRPDFTCLIIPRIGV